MSRLVFSVLAATSFAVIVGCGSDSDDSSNSSGGAGSTGGTTATIRGTVVTPTSILRSKTAVHLRNAPGVTVCADDQCDTTDTDGSFAVTADVSGGDVQLTVNGPNVDGSATLKNVPNTTDDKRASVVVASTVQLFAFLLGPTPPAGEVCFCDDDFGPVASTFVCADTGMPPSDCAELGSVAECMINCIADFCGTALTSDQLEECMTEETQSETSGLADCFADC